MGVIYCMRFPSMNRKDYLHSKRMALIQKAHLPLQIRLQRIMNQAVDERILRAYDDWDEDYLDRPTVPAYSEEVLLAEIGRQNLLATTQDFNRLLDNSLVTQDNIVRMEKLNASKSISDNITKVEVETVNQNLTWIDKTLEQSELDIKMYKDLVNKLPKQVSRQEMLQKALVKGSNYKGREYTYKELRRLSMDLERYKTAHLDYEVGMMENRQANREGLPTPNNTKTWIWSTLERTRHEGMDGQTVRFTEKFEVTNDVTGQVDYLRFPSDIENDTSNCANICNCACSYEIN